MSMDYIGQATLSTAFNAIVAVGPPFAAALTFTVQICKDGAAFSTITPTMTEIANGVYSFAMTTAHTNTVGKNVVRISSTGNDDYFFCFTVVSYNQYDAVRLGLTALPNVAAGANGGLPLGDASARVDVGRVLGTGQTAGDLAALLATLTAYVDTEVLAIKTTTDKFVFTVANQVDANSLKVGGTTQTGGDIVALLAIIAGYLDTEIAAILAKVNNLPSDPADASDIAATEATITAAVAAVLVQATIARKIVQNKTITSAATGLMTVADDGGAALYSATIFDDAAGATPYTGTAGINNRSKLA